MNCWFEGHVQGVGFRYQTMSVAKGFEVTGTVQNLTDGRVHLCAEGDESEVQAFQEAGHVVTVTGDGVNDAADSAPTNKDYS